MRRRLLIATVLTAMLALAFAVTANASLTLAFTFQGKGNYSADGLGQNGTGGFLQAEIEPGATVVQTYLYGTYFGTSNPDLTQRTIMIDRRTSS